MWDGWEFCKYGFIKHTRGSKEIWLGYTTDIFFSNWVSITSDSLYSPPPLDLNKGIDTVCIFFKSSPKVQ